MSKKQKVVCVGSMGRDIFFPTNSGEVEKDMQKGGKGEKWSFGYGEKIHIEDRFQALGGCACNISVGLSRLGVDATAYGVVGADSDGGWIKEELLRDNVDIEHVTTRKNSNSDVSFILVREDEGDRIIFANRDVGEKLKVDKNELKWYDWVFVGSLYGENRVDNMNAIHDAVVKGNMSLILNPGMSNIQNDTRKIYDLLNHTKILFVNKKEAQEIIIKGGLNIDNIDLLKESQLLNVLNDLVMDESVIVLTYGNKGAWVLRNKKITYVSVLEGEIKDTTGAGDAFASAFVAALISEKNISQAMQWGAANSHSVISEYGAHRGLLNKSKIEVDCSNFLVELMV